jgi:hypothetical protein
VPDRIININCCMGLLDTDTSSPHAAVTDCVDRCLLILRLFFDHEFRVDRTHVGSAY